MDIPLSAEAVSAKHAGGRVRDHTARPPPERLATRFSAPHRIRFGKKGCIFSQNREKNVN
jgi:hypothetical protein